MTYYLFVARNLEENKISIQPDRTNKLYLILNFISKEKMCQILDIGK